MANSSTLLMATPARPRTVPNHGLENCQGANVSSAAEVYVGFAAIDKVSVLPVDAGFESARDAVRAGGIIIDTAPFIAERSADIWSGPAEREVRRRAAIVVRRKIGGSSRRCHGARQARRHQEDAGKPARDFRQSLPPNR